MLNIDEIKEQINLYLEDDEEIISEHTSKTGNSYYVSILTPPNEILNIRISNHPSVKNNEIYSKIDINSSDYEDELKKAILSGKRKKINYLHYVALNIVHISENKNVKFYVDNSYRTFTDETAKPVFYAEFRKNKRIDIINLSNTFSNMMLSLYEHGFLIIYKSQYGKTEVSLTPGSIKILKYLKNKYRKFWDKDSRYIQWWNVDFTSNMLRRNVALAREEKRKAEERRVRLIRSKRWWIINVTRDVYYFVKNSFSKCINFLKNKFSKKNIEVTQEEVSILKKRVSKSECAKSDKEFKKIEKISVDKKMKEQLSKRSKSNLGNLVDEKTMEKLLNLKLDLDK